MRLIVLKWNGGDHEGVWSVMILVSHWGLVMVDGRSMSSRGFSHLTYLRPSPPPPYCCMAGEREHDTHWQWTMIKPSHPPSIPLFKLYQPLSASGDLLLWFLLCFFYTLAQWKERADDLIRLIWILAHYITYNNGFHCQDESAVPDLLYASNEVIMHWHHNQLQLYGGWKCGKQSYQDL